MSNEEILKKAIVKAIKNGYDKSLLPWCQECGEDWIRMIFSHDFAKAFWGVEVTGTRGWRAWAYHLREMVIEEEPIKYLEKFLK